MKRILVIFITVLMIFCTACGSTPNNQGQNTPENNQGQNNNQNNNGQNNGQEDPNKEFDKEQAIKPDPNAKTIELVDQNEAKITLTRIDTNNPYAKDFLGFAYETLETLKSDAHVTSLYSVPLGMAGNSSSQDPILVITDDESINKDPLYLVPFVNFDGGCSLLGHFRESDVKDKDYITAVSNVSGNTCKYIEKSLGFDRDDVTVLFSSCLINGYTVSSSTEDFNRIYKSCTERYFNVMFASWYNTEESESDYIDRDYCRYYRITGQDINSMADLQKYLENSFTPTMAEMIMSNIYEGTYIEQDGKLYYAGLGMGGPMDIKDIQPKYSAISPDKKKAFLIIECTRAIMDDDWNELGTTYEEYLYSFKNDGTTWKCSGYIDIPFGILWTQVY